MHTHQVIRQAKIRRIKSGSLFKFIFTICLSAFVPFFLICGVAAIFGARTVKVGDEPVTGILGLVAAIIMAPIFSGLFSAFIWLFSYITIRFIGRFRAFTLDYVTDEEPIAEHAFAADGQVVAVGLDQL